MITSKQLLILFFVLIPISLAQPVEINMFQRNYSSAETLQAYINTKNLQEDLTDSQIKLYKLNTKINTAVSLQKINRDTYYLSFDLQNNLDEGNYSLSIENVVYKENNIIKESNFKKDFQLVPSQEVASFYPTIIISNFEDYFFEINLINKRNNTIQASFDANDYITFEQNSYELSSYEGKNFQLKIERDGLTESKKGNIVINYGSKQYLIPFQINIDYNEINSSINQSQSNLTDNMSIPPIDSIRIIENKNSIDLTLATNSSLSGWIRFKNFYEFPINNLEFKTTGNLNNIIKLNITKINQIKPDHIISQYVWVNEDKNGKKGKYSGNLTLSSKYTFISTPITINIIDAESVNITENNMSRSFFDTNKTDNNNNHKEPQEKSILPYVLIAILAILISLVILFLLKSRKKKTSSINDILK